MHTDTAANRFIHFVFKMSIKQTPDFPAQRGTGDIGLSVERIADDRIIDPAYI